MYVSPSGCDLPLGRHVADDLGVVVGIDLEQGAVARRHELERGERLLLVRIETRRVGGDRGEQYPPRRGVSAARAGEACASEEGDRDRGREDDENAMTPHDLSPR